MTLDSLSKTAMDVIQDTTKVISAIKVIPVYDCSPSATEIADDRNDQNRNDVFEPAPTVKNNRDEQCSPYDAEEQAL